MIQEALALLAEGRTLWGEIATGAMRELMSGRCSEAQVGAFLMGLRLKGETVEEIVSFAEALRCLCVKIRPRWKGDALLTDVCGTGGAPLKTFNVSTVSAFVVAGAGVPVAKHGNRGITSRCGSADVVEALGGNLSVPPPAVERSIEEIGIGFLFAPNFHPALKHVAKTRKELGIRTIFNMLGPLVNPARPQAQLLGVFSEQLVEMFPEVLRALGVRRALVVYGLDGVDELSILGKTLIAELKDGKIHCYELNAQSLGFRLAQPEEIASLSAAQSAQVTKQILLGKLRDARYEMVLLNAGAGIYVSGVAASLEEGIAQADESISHGCAFEKLRLLVQSYHGSPSSDH
jgi:anthranilate phosphoribosyltransferase